MVANMGQQFGDTTLMKVLVGGLAWETQKETLREHFDKYGEILEAVIIFDKATGRSKGYKFVTFKEAEAAKAACEDATPFINGRRANCNLASLGAHRLRASPTAAPAQHQPGIAVPASRVVTTPPPPPASTGGPMYYPYGAPQPSLFQHPHHPYHSFSGCLDRDRPPLWNPSETGGSNGYSFCLRSSPQDCSLW